MPNARLWYQRRAFFFCLFTNSIVQRYTATITCPINNYNSLLRCFWSDTVQDLYQKAVGYRYVA
ncbi:hypothetical protein FAES_1273 [Fibrella aestuarina BUZ 2]|uniref:Uncharacterized protein n=1 Tax=Fibrella aestuarina BUZ 2 TaxID=1166018 RepID=I0K580_9BACT|nr:hypothetical protein FAES_1273 [Fibrella aestuarina BUZ 2]